MKKLLAILFCLVSLNVCAQTTPWSPSPAITGQTRTVSGSPQIRWLFGSNLFSLPDSLNIRELLSNKVATIDSTSAHYASTSAIKKLFAGTKISFSSGASNPITITWASYASTYGNHPTFVVHGIIGGNDMILNSVQPVINYLGGVISSIYFYLYPITFDGYIIIKP